MRWFQGATSRSEIGAISGHKRTTRLRVEATNHLVNLQRRQGGPCIMYPTYTVRRSANRFGLNFVALALFRSSVGVLLEAVDAQISHHPPHSEPSDGDAPRLDLPR
jgi:hypothetical protein